MLRARLEQLAALQQPLGRAVTKHITRLACGFLVALGAEPLAQLEQAGQAANLAPLRQTFHWVSRLLGVLVERLAMLGQTAIQVTTTFSVETPPRWCLWVALVAVVLLPLEPMAATVAMAHQALAVEAVAQH